VRACAVATPERDVAPSIIVTRYRRRTLILVQPPFAEYSVDPGATGKPERTSYRNLCVVNTRTLRQKRPAAVLAPFGEAPDDRKNMPA
jgi:hypothetical protein